MPAHGRTRASYKNKVQADTESPFVLEDQPIARLCRKRLVDFIITIFVGICLTYLYKYITGNPNTLYPFGRILSVIHQGDTSGRFCCTGFRKCLIL